MNSQDGVKSDETSMISFYSILSSMCIKVVESQPMSQTDVYGAAGHILGTLKCVQSSILVNHIECHFAAQCRFGSETRTANRVRFPAAPPGELVKAKSLGQLSFSSTSHQHTGQYPCRAAKFPEVDPAARAETVRLSQPTGRMWGPNSAQRQQTPR